jgi:hypothetical protein
MFGLIFNTLSIVLFLRKSLWETTIGLYNVIIMINCNVIIVLNIIIQFSPAIGYDALLWSNSSCVFLYYASRLTTTFSSWLNVLVALDRLFRITLWYRVVSIKKKRGQLSLIILTFISLSFMFLPNIFYSIQSKSSIVGNSSQTLQCKSINIIETYMDLVRIFMRAIIPFVLIIIINSFLIKRLIQLKSKINKNKISKNEHNFSSSIVALSTFFIISLLPLVVSLIMFQIMQKLNMTNTKAYVIANFFYNFSLLVSSYNYCFQFLVNMKFNLIFRKEFIMFYFEIKAKFHNKSDIL